jgi:hypothetical protein
VATVDTFSYTGAEQTLVVPAGVTSIDVDVQGAAGGTNGGRAQGALATTPGETLYIYVGGAATTQIGGFNGGANGGSGGTGRVVAARQILGRAATPSGTALP